MRGPPLEPESTTAKALEFEVLIFLADGGMGESLKEALALAAAEQHVAHSVHITFLDAKFAEDPAKIRTTLQQISDGTYDLIVLNAPSKSFDRKTFASRRGEGPCRDLAWARGFPWLEGGKAELVRFENACIDALVQLAEATAKLPQRAWRTTRLWLTAPEDKGSKSMGSPASIWQWLRTKWVRRCPRRPSF